jgi:hypothetical protein
MHRPVFIVGCPRSGTTLLYSMLVAAGGFACYRKETHFYEIAPRFPDLASPAARDRFLREFLAGYLGHVPGLAVEPMIRAALDESTTTGQFLPHLMARITEAQRMDRWLEGTPAHVLWMKAIKASVPDALFVHVIRDGRDCALSTARQHWAAPLGLDRRRGTGVAALYWEWMVRAGRAYGRRNAADYDEVRFEALVGEPQRALERVGRFIGQTLDFERITQGRVHALKRPNTSFREERARGAFNPVGRWKAPDVADDVAVCERLVGPYLDSLEYERAFPKERAGLTEMRMRLMYMTYFRMKHVAKAHTPLGRVLTSSRPWAEQPYAGEAPVAPIAAVSAVEESAAAAR